MSKRTRVSKGTGLAFWAAAATLTCPFLANAQSIVYQCNLSGNPSATLDGCHGSSTVALFNVPANPDGSITCENADPNNLTHPTYCGANSQPGLAIAPICAWNICRWIENISSQEIFVPFRTLEEWLKFLASPPTSSGGAPMVNVTHVGVPYTVNGSPATITITPPFAACSPSNYLGSTPNYYGRTNELYPNPPVEAGPSFTCHSGATTMMSLVQWRAGDVDTTPPGTPTWFEHYQYSPDITLSPSAAVVDEGSPVTLNWNIAPWGGASVSCSVSPGGWGPDSAGNPRTGSSVYVLPSTTVFTLSCTQSPSLTSVASAAVTGNPPPPPCCSGDGGGDGGYG